MTNSLGLMFRMTIFGESHGRCVGVVVDGCSAGLALTPSHIQMELDRRRPGQNSLTTSREEEDQVEILSGVFNGLTTGAPICLLVWNRDRDSSDYERRRWMPRPGHADWTAHVRYGGFNDYRGGGMFSGRITASFVMAGAIAKRLLMESLGVEVLAHSKEIGGVTSPDVSVDEIRANVEDNPVRCGSPVAAEKMAERIREAASEGDSVGGSVECLALNLPAGVGAPVFSTLEGDLARALYSIPAVKAVEFGLGRSFSSLKGSESNDAYVVKNGKLETETNNAGGILGGLSTGMPIKCTVTFKPTSSISKRQRTVDISKMNETTIEIKGRHDPCIVPRAVPVVEGMVAVVLADQAIRAGLIQRIMERRG